MFQVQIRHLDVVQSLRMYSKISFTVGEWFHLGVSYYDGVAKAYKNGCFHGSSAKWTPYTYGLGIIAGIRFGDESSNIGVELDEVYLWEMRKPASVFSALYVKGI